MVREVAKLTQIKRIITPSLPKAAVCATALCAVIMVKFRSPIPVTLTRFTRPLIRRRSGWWCGRRLPPLWCSPLRRSPLVAAMPVIKPLPVSKPKPAPKKVAARVAPLKKKVAKRVVPVVVAPIVKVEPPREESLLDNDFNAATEVADSINIESPLIESWRADSPKFPCPPKRATR